MIALPITNVIASDEDLETQAKNGLKSVLKDADSAKFQNLKVITNSKAEQAVCGEVNSRNSFGGYVGFTKFSYSKNKIIMLDENSTSDDLSNYNLTGCSGPKDELEARMGDEASFNCTVIWNLIVNTIVNKEDKNVALDASITAVKNRAIGNGATISPEQEKLIRSGFAQSLETTLSNKQQVRAIKSDPTYQEAGFISTCTASTVSLFKARARIK